MGPLRDPKFPVSLGGGVFMVQRLRPNGVLSVFRGGTLTLAHATLITESVMALAAHCSDPGKMVIVHDWRQMLGYESAARTHLTSWAVSHFREVHFTGIVIPDGNRMVGMGLHVAASALALVGLRLTISTSPAEVLSAARVTQG